MRQRVKHFTKYHKCNKEIDLLCKTTERALTMMLSSCLGDETAKRIVKIYDPISLLLQGQRCYDPNHDCCSTASCTTVGQSNSRVYPLALKLGLSMTWMGYESSGLPLNP